MTDFPSSIAFGRVVGRFLLAVANGTADAPPVVVPATGTITLSPVATEILATGDDPAIVVPADIVCTLDASGILCGPNGVEGVWVVTGEYTVVPAVTNAPDLPSFDIVVTADNTAAAPVNLALAAPMTPVGAQVFVVNQQVYLDTLAARDAALAAAAEAESYGASEFEALGLKTAARHDATDFDAAGTAASAVAALGSASTHPATDFDASGTAAAQIAALHLGTASTHAATDFDAAGSAAAITPAKLGLGNVSNTSDAAKPISTAQAAVNAVKADLVGGVIPTSQIPSLALNTVVPVASRAAMLALTSTQVQPGDLAVDTSTGTTRGSYMLLGTDPSQIANWVQLTVPTDVVTTVNGQQGTVVLHATDVGADIAGAAAAAVVGLAPLASPALTGTPTVPTAATGTSTTQAASTAFVAGAVQTAKAAGPMTSMGYATSAQSIAVSTLTPLAVEGIVVDPGGMAPTAADWTKWTLQKVGAYRVTVQIAISQSVPVGSYYGIGVVLAGTLNSLGDVGQREAWQIGDAINIESVFWNDTAGKQVQISLFAQASANFATTCQNSWSINDPKGLRIALSYLGSN